MLWIKIQLRQPSTWRGLALVLTTLGVSPAATNHIEAIGVGVTAALGMWDVLRAGRTFGNPGA